MSIQKNLKRQRKKMKRLPVVILLANRKAQPVSLLQAKSQQENNLVNKRILKKVIKVKILLFEGDKSVAAKARMNKCFSKKIRVVVDPAQSNPSRLKRLMSQMTAMLLKKID